MIAMPIPVTGDMPPVVSVLFAIGAGAVFVVIVWQAVRYFRSERDDERDEHDDGTR
jgi:hypothetical protein